MIGNRQENREIACVDNDLCITEPHSGRKLRIKQEKVADDSPKQSSIPKNEDSCGSSLKVKVKQEPSSKLTALKKSLEINKSISLLLEAEIQRVKFAYEKNLEKQSILQKILDEDKEAKVNDKPSQIRAISVFAAPYFRDVRRMVPPRNDDTKIKIRNQDVNAYLKPPRPWTKEENKKLLDGVTGFALFSALKPYKIKRDFLKKKLRDQNLLDFETEVIEKQIASVQKKIKCISEKPLNELLEEVDGKIDWMNISAVNMEGEKTPDECENMWNNYLNFSINKEAFTFEEDERLKNLAEDSSERNWDTIAESLKTNRTPIQCFERYQTRLSSNLRRKFWTPEEDKKLCDLVEQHRYGKIIPWNKISLLMEGRTRQQVINRYERSISQVYNRGPWTPEEDAMLIACYYKYGFHWSKMRDFFQRRSTCALRERYVNSLDPSIKMGCWTKDEDRLLITLIQRYGYGKWSKICKHIPGRTDNMCLVRAGRLLEHSVKYHSENGTGEYDPGVNDPELFAKILRPLAPTKECHVRNFKLKSCREEAAEKLLIVIRKVIPEFFIEGDDIDSIDFSWLSYELLLRISNELHRMLAERLKGLEPYVPRARYFTKPPLIRKRFFDESDEEITQSSPEKRLHQEERSWLDSVLNALFQMGGKIISPGKKNLGQVFNSRETAEISLYKAYLYKQFHCLAKCDEDDDIENVTFSGIDFSETLQTVVSYFIQPPIYEGQFIILSPNMTTIGGMEVAEVTENRLQSMSKYVSHSKNYLDYICERRKSCPKCLQCLYREQQITNNNRTPEEMTVDMRKDLFIVDDRMKEAVNVETATSYSSHETCSCAALEESRKSVQLLRQRFMALFLWPALLSATDFNKEQETILCTKESHDMHKNYFWRSNIGKGGRMNRRVGRSGKKRGRPKKQTKTDSRISLNEDDDQGEPKPSTNRSLATGDEIPAVPKKRAQKRKITKKVREYSEGLRRSKRLCVRNRSSFSFSEITSKEIVSDDASEECLATNLTVWDDKHASSADATEECLTVVDKHAVSTDASDECLAADLIVVDDEHTVSAVDDKHASSTDVTEECLTVVDKHAVSTDASDECLAADLIVVDDKHALSTDATAESLTVVDKLAVSADASNECLETDLIVVDDEHTVSVVDDKYASSTDATEECLTVVDKHAVSADASNECLAVDLTVVDDKHTVSADVLEEYQAAECSVVEDNHTMSVDASDESLAADMIVMDVKQTVSDDASEECQVADLTVLDNKHTSSANATEECLE